MHVRGSDAAGTKQNPAFVQFIFWAMSKPETAPEASVTNVISRWTRFSFMLMWDIGGYRWR